MSANSTSFKPGKSGNPGGKPKLDLRIKELAKQKTPLALKTLAEVCENSENDSARVSAAIALLDRGWGKPSQTIEAHISRESEVDLTDAELTDIAAGRSTGVAEEAGGEKDASELH